MRSLVATFGASFLPVTGASAQAPTAAPAGAASTIAPIAVR